MVPSLPFPSNIITGSALVALRTSLSTLKLNTAHWIGVASHRLPWVMGKSMCIDEMLKVSQEEKKKHCGHQRKIPVRGAGRQKHLLIVTSLASTRAECHLKESPNLLWIPYCISEREIQWKYIVSLAMGINLLYVLTCQVAGKLCADIISPIN